MTTWRRWAWWGTALAALAGGSCGDDEGGGGQGGAGASGGNTGGGGSSGCPAAAPRVASLCDKENLVCPYTQADGCPVRATCASVPETADLYAWEWRPPEMSAACTKEGQKCEYGTPGGSTQFGDCVWRHTAECQMGKFTVTSMEDCPQPGGGQGPGGAGGAGGA
jgi:hypothetical protein